MTSQTLIPLFLPNLTVLETSLTNAEILLTVAGTKDSSERPKCGMPSTKLHGSYVRTVQDTPVGILIVAVGEFAETDFKEKELE